MKNPKLLEDILAKLNVKKQTFSKMIGISGPMVGYYIKGIRSPSLKTVLKIIEICKRHNIYLNVKDFI